MIELLIKKTLVEETFGKHLKTVISFKERNLELSVFSYDLGFSTDYLENNYYQKKPYLLSFTNAEFLFFKKKLSHQIRKKTYYSFSISQKMNFSFDGVAGSSGNFMTLFILPLIPSENNCLMLFSLSDLEKLTSFLNEEDFESYLEILENF
jgi:hypothetical protein